MSRIKLIISGVEVVLEGPVHLINKSETPVEIILARQFEEDTLEPREEVRHYKKKVKKLVKKRHRRTYAEIEADRAAEGKVKKKPN